MDANLFFAVAAAASALALSASPLVRTTVVHALRHPRKSTLIWCDRAGRIVSVEDVDPSAPGLARVR